jgi:hypothetical protein
VWDTSVSASLHLPFLKITITKGICGHASTDTTCFISAMTSLGKLASQLNSTINLSDVDINQVTALLSVALVLQAKILLPLLAAAGSSFLLGITCFILFKWAAERPKVNITESSAKRLQMYRQGCLGFIWTSVGLSTASAVSVSESTAALQFWTANVPESSIIVSTGTTMQALQWVLVVLSALFALMVSSMIRVTEAGTLPGPRGNGLPPMGSTMQPASGGRFQPPGQGVHHPHHLRKFVY